MNRQPSNGMPIESIGDSPQFSGRNTVADKSESNTPVAAPDAPLSVIDRHSSFDGKFETAHDLRVEGTVAGDVTCEGTFEVASEAVARVKVKARDVRIHGRLEGEIDCDGKLILAESAVVEGTVKTSILEMHEGSVLNGNVEMTDSGSSSRRKRSTRSRAAADDDSTPSKEAPSFALQSAGAESDT